jgi:hypothetical protein
MLAASFAVAVRLAVEAASDAERRPWTHQRPRTNKGEAMPTVALPADNPELGAKVWAERTPMLREHVPAVIVLDMGFASAVVWVLHDQVDTGRLSTTSESSPNRDINVESL